MREEARLEVDRALLDDMRVALLAELGARAIYPLLARALHDRELAVLLAEYGREEVEQVERLRALMAALGPLHPRARVGARCWRGCWRRRRVAAAGP